MSKNKNSLRAAANNRRRASMKSKISGAWSTAKDAMLAILLINVLISCTGSIETKKTWEFVNTIAFDPVLASTSDPAEKTPENATRERTGEFSAYSSDENQTDSDPMTAASGKKVHSGMIANNCLPFGTKVKVNGKTYIVEDRMNKRYDCDHFYIWFSSYDEAISFGRKTIEYQIIERL